MATGSPSTTIDNNYCIYHLFTIPHFNHFFNIFLYPGHYNILHLLPTIEMHIVGGDLSSLRCSRSLHIKLHETLHNSTLLNAKRSQLWEVRVNNWLSFDITIKPKNVGTVQAT